MSEEEIVGRIVTEARTEARNKIILRSAELAEIASMETGESISAERLAAAIKAFEDGGASDKDESIVDGATYLCHQVANRVWGDCEDEDGDEWSEVDIKTEWSDFDGGNASDLFVTVRPD